MEYNNLNDLEKLWSKSEAVKNPFLEKKFCLHGSAGKTKDSYGKQSLPSPSDSQKIARAAAIPDDDQLTDKEKGFLKEGLFGILSIEDESDLEFSANANLDLVKDRRLGLVNLYNQLWMDINFAAGFEEVFENEIRMVRPMQKILKHKRIVELDFKNSDLPSTQKLREEIKVKGEEVIHEIARNSLIVKNHVNDIRKDDKNAFETLLVLISDAQKNRNIDMLIAIERYLKSEDFRFKDYTFNFLYDRKSLFNSLMFQANAFTYE